MTENRSALEDENLPQREESCLFNCGKNGQLISGGPVRVRSIKSASTERQDNLFTNLDENVPVYFHKSCVSSYTSKTHIQRAVKNISPSVVPPPPKRLKRSDIQSFDFKLNCLYCGEKCLEIDPKHPDRWRPYSQIRTVDRPNKPTLQQLILEKCELRQDDFSNKIKLRINGVIGDLHAADARYHRDCHNAFLHQKQRPISYTNTNLSCEDTILKSIINIMKEDPSRVWNSIELFDLYKCQGGSNITRKTLVKKITDLVGPSLIVLSSPGNANIVAFKNQMPFAMKLTLSDEDEECSFGNVVKKIESETVSRTVNRDSYETKLNYDTVESNISKTLLSFLKELGITGLPSLMIGNIVSSILTKQSTTLQISLSLLLNKKKLINELHKFGVTCTYSEARRFKASAAAAASKNPMLRGLRDCKDGFVQAVGDNFDTSLSTQNCLRQTHSMALLMTQVETSSDNSNTNPDIPRLSNKSMKDTLGNPVKIYRYKGPKKPPMPKSASLKTVQSLAFLASQAYSVWEGSQSDFSFLKSITLNPLETPEYSGYNTREKRLTHCQVMPQTNAIYTPLIDMTPSDPDTVITSMYEVKRLTGLTGQEYTVFTNDQQIYKVTVGIQWAYPSQFKNFVPRLGGMHMLMSFVGCVGKLMGETGLVEIMQSAFGGVNQMLLGKRFPQNVRALRLVAEETLRSILETDSVESYEDLIKVLDERAIQSKTTRLWYDCLIKPVLIMMLFIRAEREGNWPLHLWAAESMLKYFYSAGHWNYLRSAVVYVNQMSSLPKDLLRNMMENGNFVMRHQKGIWNGMWSDMFIETTYMRYGKGAGGLIGITTQPKTVNTWALSLHTVSQLVKGVGDLKSNSNTIDATQHKEENKSRIKSDLEDRQKIRNKLQTCIHPLHSDEHPNGLVNIVTGSIAPDKVNVDNALELGEIGLKDFKESLPDGFYTPLKHKVITMQSMKNGVKIGETVVFDTALIYSRVSALLLSRDLSIEQVLRYELSPVPCSMFENNGNMRTCGKKSVLKEKLACLTSTRLINPADVVVIDGCAIMWVVNWPSSGTVQDLISNIYDYIYQYLEHSNVYLVFDRYFDFSIKSATRQSRKKGVCKNFQLHLNTVLPPKNVVLNNENNKVQLIDLLCQEIVTKCRVAKLNHQLNVTGRDPVPLSICQGTVIPLTHLKSTHEEADVIIVQQVISAAKLPDTKRIMVICDDTDVFLLLCHYYTMKIMTCELYQTSTKHERQTIDIGKTVQTHELVIPKLLCAHAISGCDTVPYLYGLGKATVLKNLNEISFDSFGKDGASTEQIVKEGTTLIAACYGVRTATTMSDVRVAVWTRRTGSIRTTAPPLKSLPPTTEAFIENMKRAHLQVMHWYSVDDSDPPNIDPTMFGWEKDEKMKSLKPIALPKGIEVAPAEVLNIIKCNCSSQKPCSSTKCSCSGKLPCTIFCKCYGKECLNQQTRIRNELLQEEDIPYNDI